MVLTHERAYTLTKIINADKERAKALLNLKVEDATRQINALGYDFKSEEIKEYGKAIRCYMGGHIRDSDLDSISGGIVVNALVADIPINEMRW